MLLKLLKSFFVIKKTTYASRLEQYLESKGCTDASCIEHWIKEFERKQHA